MAEGDDFLGLLDFLRWTEEAHTDVSGHGWKEMRTEWQPAMENCCRVECLF